jgi:hypothetical protein
MISGDPIPWRTAALVNKLARIAWTVPAQERSYEAHVIKAAA